jgi:hypothetical protein
MRRAPVDSSLGRIANEAQPGERAQIPKSRAVLQVAKSIGLMRDLRYVASGVNTRVRGARGDGFA